jgi:hypothetical protein
MEIKKLIAQLTELKAAGAEKVEFLDTTWNPLKMEVISTDSTGRRALIFVDVEESASEDVEDFD